MSVLTSDSDLDFSKLKVAELKNELKKRGLSTEGKKNELVERLQTSIGDAALLDDTHDDLLDDAELSDEVLDETPIDTPPPEPVKSSPLKRAHADEEEKRHPKKIILNRKTIEAPDPLPEPEPAQPAKSEQVVVDKKPKLHVLSEKERREKRAARFGSDAEKDGPITEAVAAKVARTAVTPITTANIDLLKKRAERFGTIAPVLEKVKVEEKKMERLKRFGAAQLNSPKTAITAGDKKAQRAARFAS